MEQCRLFKGGSCALLVQDAGKGMVRDNAMHGHEVGEVEVRSNGAPLLAGNRIHDSKGSGILVDGAGGEYHRNDIYGNARAGICLRGGGSALFTHNRVSAGAQSGVVVEALSFGTLESNVIVFNGHCGIELRDDGDATLRLNVVSRNGHFGLLFYNGAQGLVQGNDINAVSVGHFCSLLGLFSLYIGPLLTLVRTVGNDIKANGMSGIAVMLNASPRIIGNHIHSNLQSGLCFMHGGKGVVQVCQCKVGLF